MLSKLLINIRWIPRLVWLALASRVAVRIRHGKEYVYVDTASDDFNKQNGIVRVELTLEEK